MKAISLWQPWASLWCSDTKVHETRHWPTTYRGWLLVHAAKRAIDDLNGDVLGVICDSKFGHHYGVDLPRGAIIGIVNLVACKRTEDMPAGFEATDDYECGDYSDGRFAWERREFRLFERAIPYRGAQGFFNVPDELIASVTTPPAPKDGR